MTPLKLIIWMMILIAIGAFSVQNLQTVELKYYNFKFELKTILTPLAGVISLRRQHLLCFVTLNKEIGRASCRERV